MLGKEIVPRSSITRCKWSFRNLAPRFHDAGYEQNGMRWRWCEVDRAYNYSMHECVRLQILEWGYKKLDDETKAQPQLLPRHKVWAEELPQKRGNSKTQEGTIRKTQLWTVNWRHKPSFLGDIWTRDGTGWKRRNIRANKFEKIARSRILCGFESRIPQIHIEINCIFSSPHQTDELFLSKIKKGQNKKEDELPMKKVKDLFSTNIAAAVVVVATRSCWFYSPHRWFLSGCHEWTRV